MTGTHRPFYATLYFWLLVIGILGFIAFAIAYEWLEYKTRAPWWVWILFIVSIIIFAVGTVLYLAAVSKKSKVQQVLEACSEEKKDVLPVAQRPKRLDHPTLSRPTMTGKAPPTVYQRSVTSPSTNPPSAYAPGGVLGIVNTPTSKAPSSPVPTRVPSSTAIPPIPSMNSKMPIRTSTPSLFAQ